MIKTKKESPEVLYSLNKYTTVNEKDLSALQQKGLRNKKRIIRLCIHKSKKDLVHEMFIVFPKSYYCKPHKHTTEESMSVITGQADVILFKNNGEIFKVIEMGDLRSKKMFYYKLHRNTFHTLLIKSKYLFFYEVTKGPFKKSNMKSPKWAPGENKLEIKLFLYQLKKKITDFKKKFKNNKRKYIR